MYTSFPPPPPKPPPPYHPEFLPSSHLGFTIKVRSPILSFFPFFFFFFLTPPPTSIRAVRCSFSTWKNLIYVPFFFLVERFALFFFPCLFLPSYGLLIPKSFDPSPTSIPHPCLHPLLLFFFHFNLPLICTRDQRTSIPITLPPRNDRACTRTSSSDDLRE